MHFSALRSVPCKTLNTLQYIAPSAANTSTVVRGHARIREYFCAELATNGYFLVGQNKLSGSNTLASSNGQVKSTQAAPPCSPEWYKTAR